MAFTPPPDFRDIARAKRIQSNKFLSASSVINRGGKSNSSVVVPPDPTPSSTIPLTPSITPTITPTPTNTLTNTPTPTNTLTNTPTNTPTCSQTPTNTPTITVTPTVTVTTSNPYSQNVGLLEINDNSFPALFQQNTYFTPNSNINGFQVQIDEFVLDVELFDTGNPNTTFYVLTLPDERKITLRQDQTNTIFIGNSTLNINVDTNLLKRNIIL